MAGYSGIYYPTIEPGGDDGDRPKVTEAYYYLCASIVGGLTCLDGKGVGGLGRGWRVWVYGRVGARPPLCPLRPANPHQHTNLYTHIHTYTKGDLGSCADYVIATNPGAFTLDPSAEANARRYVCCRCVHVDLVFGRDRGERRVLH